MRINWKYVSAALAIGWAYDTKVALHNKKLLVRAVNNFTKATEVNGLLINTLERNNIAPEPFEMIAIAELTRSMS